MLIFRTKAELNKFLTQHRGTNSTLGFVPTMGALHEGHLSLLNQSMANNSVTVISIFVNPTQFNNSEDLLHYPRTLDDDVKKIKTISDTIIVYAPTVEDIYEGNTTSQHYNFDGLEHQMEGKFRLGHFDGVGTVVQRLFDIVQPDTAYFGEKDFQQLQIIKKLVEKEKLSVKIIGCSIHREANGLAMSSRNLRLTDQQRKEAALVFKTLQTAKQLFGTKSAKEVSEFVTQTFQNHAVFELEYFEIADESTLKSCIRKNKNKKYRAFIAVFVNKIRLIDTISLN